MKKARECVGWGSESRFHRIAPRMALQGNCRNEAVHVCDQGSRFLSGIVDAVQGLEMLLPVFVLSLTLVRKDRPRVETLARIVVSLTTIRESEELVRAYTRLSTRGT